MPVGLLFSHKPATTNLSSTGRINLGILLAEQYVPCYNNLPSCISEVGRLTRYFFVWPHNKPELDRTLGVLHDTEDHNRSEPL